MKISRLTQGAAILSITTFGSYGMGLIRDRIFAHTFGLSRELDIYNAAFIVPDLLFTIFISSAISPAFVPLFTSLHAQGESEKAHKLGTTVLIAGVALVTVLAAIGAILMPYFAPYIGEGFSVSEQKELIHLTRLMMISPVMIALSSCLGAMLVSFKSFFAYGISTMLYNFGIIIGALSVPFFGLNGLVFGTLLGGALHVLPRAIAIRKIPFRFLGKPHFKDIHFIQMLKLTLPKMLGHPVEQLKFLGFTKIATLLIAGSVTAVSFARNFQSVPVLLFGAASAVAAFPVLSSCAAREDRSGFLTHFYKSLREILLFTVPSAIGLFLLSELPIRIFLGGGEFSNEHIVRTGQVLAAFALAIPFESLVHLLARSFYALKNTIIPVVMSLVSLTVSLSFAYLNYGALDILAIPYGFSLGSLTEVLGLSLVLFYRLRKIPLSVPVPEVAL